MQRLTYQRLTKNAFRMLGLSASADLGAIENAARKMRIWPDPQRIPPTAWDLNLWMEPITRSRADIEQAVATLNEPRSRLEERLLWYHGTNPPQLDGASPASCEGESQASQQHNQAVAALHLAHTFDADITDVSRWRQVLKFAGALAVSPSYAAWLLETDNEGDFEKRASEAEVEDAVSALAPAIAAALVLRAQTALDGSDFEACTRIVSVLEEENHVGVPSKPVRDLIDSLEDTLTRRCEELDADLRATLRTDRSAPSPYYPKNRVATENAARFYNQKIDPLFVQLREIAKGDPLRVSRIQSNCADALMLLALGWEWTGEFETACLTLRLVLDMVEEGAVADTARADLARCQLRAEEQRKTPYFVKYARAAAYTLSQGHAQHTAVRKKPKSKSTSRTGVLIAIGFLASRFIAGLLSQNNHSSGTSSPTLPHYPFNSDGNSQLNNDIVDALKREVPPLLPETEPHADPVPKLGATGDPATPPPAPPLISESVSATRPSVFGETNREK